MKSIERKDIPTLCPKCQSSLKSYHGPSSVTRLVCSQKCSGFAVVVLIDHSAEARGETSAIRTY